MLPVTPFPPRMPGSWGSPFGRPHEVELHKYPKGYVIPKGCWVVHCTTNKVEFFVQPLRPEDEDEHERPHRPPPRPPREYDDTPHVRLRPRHVPPTFPPSGGNGNGDRDNETAIYELVREHTTGSVFADGENVKIRGSGTAVIIEVFSV